MTVLSFGLFDRKLHQTLLLIDVEFVLCSLSNSILQISAAIYSFNMSLQTSMALLQTAGPWLETLHCTWIFPPGCLPPISTSNHTACTNKITRLKSGALITSNNSVNIYIFIYLFPFLDILQASLHNAFNTYASGILALCPLPPSQHIASSKKSAGNFLITSGLAFYQPPPQL